VVPCVVLSGSTHHAFILSIRDVEVIVVFSSFLLLFGSVVWFEVESDSHRVSADDLSKTFVHVPLDFALVAVGEEFSVRGLHPAVLVDRFGAGVFLHYLLSPRLLLQQPLLVLVEPALFEQLGPPVCNLLSELFFVESPVLKSVFYFVCEFVHVSAQQDWQVLVDLTERPSDLRFSQRFFLSQQEHVFHAH